MAEKARRSVGFVGLGLMGGAFTRRLMERGYGVVGFDVVAEKVRAARAHGVVAAASAADVVRRAEIVLMCVTSTHAVEEAVFGPEGVAAGGSAGKILVDHSTTEIAATRELSAKLQAACGMSWVDAPVSGGPAAAAAGTLAIMAGGEEQAIVRIAPVMAVLGNGDDGLVDHRVVHVNADVWRKSQRALINVELRLVRGLTVKQPAFRVEQRLPGLSDLQPIANDQFRVFRNRSQVFAERLAELREIGAQPHDGHLLVSNILD